MISGDQTLVITYVNQVIALWLIYNYAENIRSAKTLKAINIYERPDIDIAEPGELGLALSGYRF